ncbi:MAG: nucleotidyltransferase family protein [Anaerolineae bacterium]|nr:nucleotidyltransferase family protein [Anaerolineae bacterium]
MAAVEIPYREIAAFCRTWAVREFALFGSVLRDDFTPESDIDVLVTFQPGHRIRFADLMVMEEQLTRLFGRRVDLGTRHSVESDENYLRRKAILDSVEVIYAA